MSAALEQMFQAGLKCDKSGCKVSVWRIAAGSDLAEDLVQREAALGGWSVSGDRERADYDLCPDHAREAREAVEVAAKEATG